MTARIHEITIALTFTREDVLLLIKDSGWPVSLKNRFVEANYPYPHRFDCDDISFYLNNKPPFGDDFYKAFFTFATSHVSDSIIESVVDEYLEELRAK